MPAENKPYRVILASMGALSVIEGVLVALSTLGVFGAGEFRLTLLRLVVTGLDGLAAIYLLLFTGLVWTTGLAQRIREYWLCNPLQYMIAVGSLVILFTSGFALYNMEAATFGRLVYYIDSLQPQIIWIALLSLQGLVVLSLSLPDMMPTWAQWGGSPSRIAVPLILITFVGIALYAWFRQSSPSIVSDSGDYLSMRQQPLFSRAFYLGLRPWAIVLFYKLLPADGSAIVVFQTLLFIFSWGFLTWTISRSLKRGWLRVGIAAVTLFMALTHPVNSWNHVVLSESIAISLFVLMLALVIRLGYGQAAYFFPLVLTTLLWINSRETNTLLALFMAASLLVAGIIWKPRAFYFAAGLLLLGMVAFSLISSRLARRSNFPLANIIVQRILVDRSALRYFQKRGMPVNQKLKNLAGEWAYSDKYAIFNNPRLRSFYRWLNTEGTRDYAVFLLSRPLKTLGDPLANLDKLLQPTDGYAAPGYTPVIPYPLGSLVFISLSPVVLFLLVLLLSLTGFFVAIRGRDPLLLLVSMSGTLIYPHAFLVWHGDALEIPRHAAQLYVQVYLTFWLLLAAWTDQLLIRLKVAGSCLACGTCLACGKAGEEAGEEAGEGKLNVRL